MFQNRDLREIVRIVARNSNMSNLTSRQLYKKYDLFATAADWKTFINIALLSLGIGFALSGIIFFFAYNWEDLPKAAKIGMMEALVITSACYAIFSKSNSFVKNIALMAAAVLTGALITVYGQIYQTGADSYDLFLAWALAILIWTLFSNFPALWLLQLLLFNLVLWRYEDQIVNNLHESTLPLLLFLLNVIPLLLLEYLGDRNKLPQHSKWMIRIVGIAAAFFITMSVAISIVSNGSWPVSGFGMLAVLILFPLGIWHSLRQRELFYLSLISLSAIVIGTVFIMEALSDESGFFLAAIFVIASISILTYKLIQLNRKWHGNNNIG